MRILILGCLLNLCVAAHAQQSACLTTPRGSVFPAIFYNAEPLSTAQIAATNQSARQMYPNAVLVANASGKYNCHSYAWYQQSSSANNYWLNSPSDDAYWLDGSYTIVNTATSKTKWLATKWSYWVGDHSATAYPLGQSVTFRSKWGQWPLMDHNWNYSPYNSSSMVSFESCPAANNSCRAAEQVSTSNVTKNNIRLTWSRACNATGYNIEYQIGNSTSWYSVTAVFNTPLVRTPHLLVAINLTVNPNTCYKFRVRTTNGSAFATSATVSVCSSTLGKVVKSDSEEELLKQKATVVLEDYDLSRVQVSVQESDTESKLLGIYPNPTPKDFRFDFHATQNSVGKLMVTDMLGKVVFKKDYELFVGKNNISVHELSLPAGSYIVVLDTDTDGSYKQKLVIQ